MINSFKWISVLVVCMLCISCISIGRHTVTTHTDAKVDPSDNRVVLVLLDRVNQKTFSRYVTALRNQDYEPRHLSGISLLARNQFKLANTAYAQSSIPSTTAVSEATILTGRPPIEHGILGPRQSRFLNNNPRMELDLTSSASQTRFFLTSDWGLIQPNEPNLGGRLIQVEPWVKTVHQSHPTATIFTAFGRGANWHLPLVSDPLATALFSKRVSKQTAQVLDEHIEEVTQDAMALGSSLTIFRFLGAWGYSCVNARPGCQDESKSLETRQLEALQEIDIRLWRLFRNYQMRMPNRFKNTTFIISGTTGVIERPQHTINNPDYHVDVDNFSRALASGNPETCDGIIDAAAKRQQFSLHAFSGTVMIQRKVLPNGQRHLGRALSKCLSLGFQRLMTNLEERKALDGAVWLSTDNQTPAFRFTPSFTTENGALAQRRIEDKLTSALQPANHMQVLAMGFLRPPFVFSTETEMRLHEGGIRSAALSFPFLLADRRLSQSARRQVEGASIDHIDFAPTVMGLLGLGKGTRESLTRRPLLEFHGTTEAPNTTLRFARSRRDSYGSANAKSPLHFKETDKTIQILYHEDRTIWPPDTLQFLLENQQRTWQNTTQSFAQSDCEFLNGSQGRTWSCTLAKPEGSKTATLVVKRTPELDDNRAKTDRTTFYLRTTPPTIKSAQLQCSDEDNVVLAIDLDVPDGLANVTLEEAGIDTDGHLSVFEAETVDAASLLRAMDKESAANLPIGITQLKGQVQLDRIYDRIDPPARLHVCANSGRCSVIDITPLTQSDNCIF